MFKTPITSKKSIQNLFIKNGQAAAAGIPAGISGYNPEDFAKDVTNIFSDVKTPGGLKFYVSDDHYVPLGYYADIFIEYSKKIYELRIGYRPKDANKPAYYYFDDGNVKVQFQDINDAKSHVNNLFNISSKSRTLETVTEELYDIKNEFENPKRKELIEEYKQLSGKDKPPKFIEGLEKLNQLGGPGISVTVPASPPTIPGGDIDADDPGLSGHYLPKKRKKKRKKKSILELINDINNLKVWIKEAQFDYKNFDKNWTGMLGSDFVEVWYKEKTLGKFWNREGSISFSPEDQKYNENIIPQPIKDWVNQYFSRKQEPVMAIKELDNIIKELELYKSINIKSTLDKFSSSKNLNKTLIKLNSIILNIKSSTKNNDLLSKIDDLF
jgi:hypothetical protein